MNPRFLTLEEAFDIHRDQIERYGGSDGVGDLGLLQAALAMPSAGFGGQYAHRDFYKMATAYLYHIAAINPLLMATSAWRQWQLTSFSH